MQPPDSDDILSCQFEATEEQAGERLDRVVTDFLQQLPNSSHDLPEWFVDEAVTRSKVSGWIEEGFVSVDQGRVSKPAHRVRSEAVISVDILPPEPTHLEPDPSISINVVHEDNDLLVLDKQAGMVVHPGAGNQEGTLVHGLLAHLGESLETVGGYRRPGLVHRLDKDTTGLMVVAKTNKAYEALVKQFGSRTISREYLALTLNPPHIDETITMPIGRHPTKRKLMAVNRESGREAVTEWRMVEELQHGVLLKLNLKTGRTHQIRVHLKAAGAPIVGDTVYGCTITSVPHKLQNAVKQFGRQALHAAKLHLEHPTSGKDLSFEAPLPEDMEHLVRLFREKQ